MWELGFISSGFNAGMKTLVWSITHFNASNQMQVSQPPGSTPGGPKGMREDEVSLRLFSLFEYCLKYFFMSISSMVGCIYIVAFSILARSHFVLE